jgi:hypothetical protein
LIAVWMHTPGGISLGTSAPPIADVRVVSEQEERTAGAIFLLHYIVYGNVINVGNGTSEPIVVTLQITSPEGMILLNTNETVIPDILPPKGEGSYTFKLTRYCTMVTLTKSDVLFLHDFVRKIASDIVDSRIRHSTIFLPIGHWNR